MFNNRKYVLTVLIFLQFISILLPVYYMKYAERNFDVNSLDPINAERTWRQLRFNTLIHGRLWYKDDKMQNIPDLVESLPTQSNSRETIVKIRDDARWHDGREITASDVIFSFNLYRECNISEYSSIAKKLIVEQIDNKTIRIKPEIGTSSFWYYVTDGVSKLYILPKHSINEIGIILPGDNYSKKPLGSGTYKIENVTKDSERKIIELSRHPYYYYDEFASNEKIKEITMTTEPIMSFIVDGLTINNENSYKKNSSKSPKRGLDLIVEEMSSISNLQLLQAYPHIRSKSYEKNRWTGLAINTRKQLLDNIDFRILLDKMINNKLIMNNSYDDGAMPITGPFHPSFGIQKEGLLDRYESDMSVIVSELENKYKVKKIKNSLHVLDRNTGKNIPLEFRILFNKDFVQDGSREDDAIQEIKNRLEQYGIKVILDGNSRETYKIKILDYDYWDLAFEQKEFSWNNNIWPIFNPNNTSHTGNITGYNNPVLTDLFKKFFRTPNVRVKQELGEQIHQHCYDNVPYLFLWSPEPICFYRDVLRDLTITPMEFFSTSREWGVKNRQ